VAAADVMRWGSERVRAGTWRGQADVAYLAPVPGAPAPSPAFVRRCLDRLAARGFRQVLTGAFSPAEQRGFLAAGFDIREHLLLLAHDLVDVPALPPARTTGHRLRRARRRDRPAALAIDARAFQPFWQLDPVGLDEALAATPATRFRLAEDGGGELLGYAVVGRADRRGYVQRLAVDPDRQRAGVGRHLLLDGLHWLHRRDVERAVVNTQPGNDRALALYQSVGFRLQPTGLDVLACQLSA
jgi:[ribosomal protein S18]-alanine N-acetyltransferase